MKRNTRPLGVHAHHSKIIWKKSVKKEALNVKATAPCAKIL
jgi:hypothetical protein